MRPARATTPPMLPPTMAPVCVLCLSAVAPADGASGSEVEEELAADVLRVDETVLASTVPETVEGDGIVSVVRDSDDAEELESVDDDEDVPITMGVARELLLCVSETSTLDSVKPPSETVAAKSLAVPHPNCEYPPSKIFL